jgi:hypothetical protein
MAPTSPTGHSTVCIPSHWSMDDSVNAFKNYFARCPDVWHLGQFVWRGMLSVLGTSGKPTMTAQAYYSTCLGMLNADTPAVDKLSDIEPWVRAHGVFDDTMLSQLFDLSKAGCFAYVGHVARFLQRHGGLKGCFASAPPLSLGQIYTGQVTFAAPWFEIVRYDAATLARIITTLRQCLDAGYVVRAGVVSGTDSPSLNNPEHYLLVIGYDADTFVYWDTDSLVSNRPPFGPAFGTLTYRHLDPYHTLGNARSDEELACSGAGNFTLETASTIPNMYRGQDWSLIGSTDFRVVNHRYQVTSLEKL